MSDRQPAVPEQTGLGAGASDTNQGENSLPVQSPKPLSDRRPGTLPDRDEKIVLALEARMIRVLRRESMDPYAGLPADDVLIRLHERFPDQNFPERMLRRLELEQEERHKREARLDGIEQYVAETDRINGIGDRELQKSWGRRAERIVILLVAVGLLCLFTGYEAAGITVLGVTLVGVVGAFLAQQVKGKK